MDTKRCPFCSQRIPADAALCHHCGESWAAPSRRTVLEEQQEPLRIPPGKVDEFTLAYLRGAELSGAFLSGVDLFAANLVGASLRGADLGGANLGSADLSRADLTGANLTGTDLSDAILCGADLRDTRLQAVDLSGATYDDFTLWPSGFDPVEAGAVYAGRQESGDSGIGDS